MMGQRSDEIDRQEDREKKNKETRRGGEGEHKTNECQGESEWERTGEREETWTEVEAGWKKDSGTKTEGERERTRN